MDRAQLSSKKKLFKKNYYFKKFVIFPCIFLLNFSYYKFVFLYRKDTNLVSKVFVFIHTAKYLKEKKIISYFHTTKIQKYVLACILALITSLLKSQELGQYFINSKKIILFSFSIWGYDLIRKTYSEY
jgi:hypothetical protein